LKNKRFPHPSGWLFAEWPGGKPVEVEVKNNTPSGLYKRWEYLQYKATDVKYLELHINEL
jgi:hypothetical protein